MIRIEDQIGTSGAKLRLLRLDRADKANALSRAMLGQLAEAVEQASAAGFRALILTGSGRVFSAGADLDEIATGLGTDPLWERLSGAIAAFPGLSIAALNGTLAGGAFGMALACDLRLGIAPASFFYPVMRLGILPQPSDALRLDRLIGPSRTRMILLAGQKVTAQTALDWGLLDQITTSEALLPTALALAADALAAKPGHAEAIKALLP